MTSDCCGNKVTCVKIGFLRRCADASKLSITHNVINRCLEVV